MELDEERSVPNDSQLRRIANLADLQVKYEDEVARLEEALKRANINLRQIAEGDLPQAMSEVGLKKAVTAKGFSISIETDYYASLTGKYREPALKWLRKEKLDPLINRVVSVVFGKGEDEKADRLLNLIKVNLPKAHPLDKEEVHTGSFKAAVKEMLEKGRNVPLGDIGVNEVTRAKIERARTEN